MKKQHIENISQIASSFLLARGGMKKQHIENISQIVSSFLLARGGMRNGYNTFAEGTVNQNYANVSIGLPNDDDMTKRELRELGVVLGKKIQEYLRETSIYTVDLSTECSSHGCYSTEVMYAISAPVKLF